MVWTTRPTLNDIWPCSTFCGEDSSSAVLCCWSKTSSGPLLAPDRYCWSLLVTYYHPSLLLLGKISLGLQVSSESIQLVVADDSHVSSLLLLEIFSLGLRVSSVSILLVVFDDSHSHHCLLVEKISLGLRVIAPCRYNWSLLTTHAVICSCAVVSWCCWLRCLMEVLKLLYADMIRNEDAEMAVQGSWYNSKWTELYELYKRAFCCEMFLSWIFI